jgi:hypothetical protein
MNSSPSENILELRRLSAKLCEVNDFDNNNNKEIIIEVKKIVETSKAELAENKTPKEKVKCYENMYTTITKLLQKLK